MNNIDAFFCSKADVFQGESLSHFLFSMFVNDINNELSTAQDAWGKDSSKFNYRNFIC